MFHPRPFGGIAGIFAKSSRSDPNNRNDGSTGQVPDSGAAVADAPGQQRAVSLHRNVPTEDGGKGFHRVLEGRRSIEEPKPLADPKVFSDMKMPADPKPFGERRPFGHSKPAPEHRRAPDLRHPQDNKTLSDMTGITEVLQQPAPVVPSVSSKSETLKPQLKIEIPAEAEQRAMSEAIYDKLYLLQLMMNMQRISTEQGVTVIENPPPKLKFLLSTVYVQHHTGPRDAGHGHREGFVGLYSHTAQSLFDQGEAGRKSMDIAPGQRRNYFDQRVPKGKESFVLGREGYDMPGYPKRGDLLEGDQHFADGHARWKTYDNNALRNDSKFGFERFKSPDGMGILDAEQELRAKGLEHLKQRASQFPSPGGASALHGGSDVSMQSLLHEQSPPDRYDVSEHYPPFDGSAHNDALLLGLERHAMHRPSADMHFNKSVMMPDAFGAVESTEQKLLQYTALAASVAQAQPVGGITSDASPWPSTSASDLKAPSVKAEDVFGSPLLKNSGNSVSFLERLLDKSFDTTEPGLDPSIAEATAQFQKSLQLSTEQRMQTQNRIEVQTQLQSHLILQSHLQSELEAQMQAPLHGRQHMSSQASLNMQHKMKAQMPLKSQHPLRSQLQSKPQQLKSQLPNKSQQLKSQSQNKLQPLSKSQQPLKAQPPLKPQIAPKSQSPLPLQMQSVPSSHANLHVNAQPQLPVQQQLQPHLQQTIPPTIDLQWQYMDFHGLVHGPFSSKQMYTWYINNFFNPNLKMRYNQMMPWTPFKDLYPVSSRAFLENPVGYTTEEPQTTTIHHQAPETPKVIVTPPTTSHSVEAVSADAAVQISESPQMSSQRWNKPDELKVDSLLDIMEKQKRQSVPKAVPKSTAPPEVPKPSPGWKVADIPGPSPVVASDDFPSLALGVEKVTKPKKKPVGTTTQQGNTMTLKAFMKHQAQTPENTRVHPRESFASKLMGNNK
ncbi:grb10 interacting GYF, putative [Babesia ovata]|uniref:Grb10 interacting GYF, putative n=1 Tax=Babesia ovata TaxID=189622 RepID=A0A2H6KCX5_9APIC|nr:grb10 interacting GYF, putative [Babesia ovata]GBE60848.1 grb10 interacting GYF, putative [Babesia ovata]